MLMIYNTSRWDPLVDWRLRDSLITHFMLLFRWCLQGSTWLMMKYWFCLRHNGRWIMHLCVDSVILSSKFHVMNGLYLLLLHLIQSPWFITRHTCTRHMLVTTRNKSNGKKLMRKKSKKRNYTMLCYTMCKENKEELVLVLTSNG